MAIDLSQPIGPLPLGLWVAGGGIGLGLLYVRSKNKATVTTTDTTPGLSPLNTVGDGSQSLWIQQSPPTPTPTAITSNQDWFIKAESDLVAKGYDPAVVDQALRKYLIGADPGPAGWVIVRMAIALEGPLPEGIPPADGNGPPVNGIPSPPSQAPGPVKTPKPPVVKPPPPAKKRTVTVTPWPTPHSTLSGIAKDVYGDASQWQKIYNANRDKIHNPNLIYPGQVLVIP